MIGIAIVFALLPSLLLGLLALGVVLQWHLPYQTLPYWFFILCGLLVVLSVPGLLIAGNLLACLLTTSC
jgi:hypothetical protein